MELTNDKSHASCHHAWGPSPVPSNGSLEIRGPEMGPAYYPCCILLRYYHPICWGSGTKTEDLYWTAPA